MSKSDSDDCFTKEFDNAREIDQTIPQLNPKREKTVSIASKKIKKT